MKAKQKEIGNWQWAGMGYRDNGDGFGKFKNTTTGQMVRVGAVEAGWDSSKETYREACFRAMQKRIDEGTA